MDIPDIDPAKIIAAFERWRSLTPEERKNDPSTEVWAELFGIIAELNGQKIQYFFMED